MPIDNIVISVLDVFAKTTLSEFLARFALGEDAKYHLVHVVEPPTPRMPGDHRWEAARSSGHKTGKLVVDDIAEAVHTIVPRAQVILHVREGKPSEEIIKLAEEQKASLIVMGTRGRKGLRRLFLGSVSADVANSAKCSVVILKQNGHLYNKRQCIS